MGVGIGVWKGEDRLRGCLLCTLGVAGGIGQGLEHRRL